MKVENENIVITDPCYVLKEEDMDKYVDDHDDTFLKEYFRDFIIADTGIGDWSNSVYMNDEKIGDFAADAGMVFVCTLSDLLNYREDAEQKIKFLQPRCLTIVPDFTGDITVERRNKLAVVVGKNNNDVIFYTDGFEEKED